MVRAVEGVFVINGNLLSYCYAGRCTIRPQGRSADTGAGNRIRWRWFCYRKKNVGTASHIS